MSNLDSNTPAAGLQRNSSAPKRTIGRPWKPGQSGNPAGKRKGCVSLAARLKGELTPADARAICRKLIELARAGDLAAVKLVFDKLDGADFEVRLAAIEQLVKERNHDRN